MINLNNMKKIVMYMAALAVAFGVAACKGKEPQPTPPGPEPGPGGGNDTTVVERPNTDKLPVFEMPFYDALPLEAGNLLAEGSDVGVTIEVTKVEDNNFVFELRPGAMVQSFKIDVYPLAQMYNNLLNDKNSGALASAESWAVNERIREYLFNESGSGGYSFSIDDFESAEDFLQIEFDWMNTAYASASAIAIPDCEYLIAVVASTDKTISSSNQEDITLCYVHTTSQPLIGDPQCEIEVNAGYRVFGVQHHLNADAAGVYFFGWLTEEIDDYIDTFDETMFRDFVRTRVTSPSVADDPNNPESLYYSVNYGDEADASILSTTVAVAVDANLTPQKDFTRVDFHLKEMPDEEKQPVADLEITVVPERIAAAYFEFDVEFAKECQTVFYRCVSKEEADSYKAMSDRDKRTLARTLRDEAYGWHNPNFAWDANNDVATGAGATCRLDMFGGLFPGETYEIVYVGRNGFGTLTELKFSEPFTLDQRNTSSPDASKVKDFTLTLDNPGRTQFRGTVTYDPSTVSMVYIQYMTAQNNPGLDENSSWKEWIDFIFTPSSSGTGSAESSSMLVNLWPTQANGRDWLTWTGMEPATEYTVFACAEDFDGNISPMFFDKIVTNEIQVGPDPTIVMDLVPANSYPYDWTVTYTIDHDVEYFLYCYTKSAADLSAHMPGLNQGHLNNIKNSGFSYEEWYNGIYEWVAGGFENNGGGMRTESDTSQDWEGNEVVIAACIAVGRDDNGPVYKMYHLICKDGKAQTLEEIFGIE